MGSLGMFIVDNHCAISNDEHKLYLEVYKNHNNHEHPYPELLKNKIPYKAGVKITFQSKVNRNYTVDSDFKLTPNFRIFWLLFTLDTIISFIRPNSVKDVSNI